MTFRFRQFEVEDDRSTMKVGTDSMLLGSWADPGASRRILDIGTGCGVLALMMAQKSKAFVTGIDTDQESAAQAGKNFARSPWPSLLESLHVSLQDYSGPSAGCFDMIISNPPFFTNALKSPARARNKARHDDTLGIDELIDGVCRLLCPEGKFFLILPADRTRTFVRKAGYCGLNVHKRMVIRSKPGAIPVRIALELAFRPCHEPAGEELVIRNPDNSYSTAYRELTKEFHYGLG